MGNGNVEIGIKNWKWVLRILRSVVIMYDFLNIFRKKGLATKGNKGELTN